MDETFGTELSSEELRPLLARRDGPGIVRATVQFGALALATLGIALAQGPIALAVAVGAHAVTQVGLFAMMHECVHRTAFATGSLNTLGVWVASPWQFHVPTAFRDFHFTHHRHTHDVARDPELAGMEILAAWPTGAHGVANATGLPVLFARVIGLVVFALGAPAFVADKFFPYIKDRQRVAWESRAWILLYAGATAAAWLWMPQLLYVWVAVLVAHALLSLYLACEHRGLPAGGGILDRTRTFDVGPIPRWWMWNMPYHAEHHGWPGVPFHALPALHARVGPALPHATGGVIALHWRGGR